MSFPRASDPTQKYQAAVTLAQCLFGPQKELLTCKQEGEHRTTLAPSSLGRKTMPSEHDSLGILSPPQNTIPPEHYAPRILSPRSTIPPEHYPPGALSPRKTIPREHCPPLFPRNTIPQGNTILPGHYAPRAPCPWGGMFAPRAPGACPVRYLCIKFLISSPKFILTLESPPSRPH